MTEGTGSIITKIIMDTTQITQGTQRVNEFKEAVALAKKSKDKSTLFDGEIRSLKELQEQLRQAQTELKRLNDISAAKERVNVALQNKAIKETSKSIQEQMQGQQRLNKLNDDGNDKFMAAMEKQRLLGLAKGDRGSEAFIASQLKQQRLNDDANDKFMATREAQYQRQLAMGDKGVEAALANQRKISAANDLANDKFMVSRDKQYQAQLAMGDKGVAAFQANQRKMAQAHMDSIVKQNNAEKTSYNQYLNGLARKYEAQGKANDAANNRYIQGLVRQDAKEAQLSAQFQARQAKNNPANPENYVNLSALIRKAATKAERLWTIQNKSGKASDISAYNEQTTKLRALNAVQNEYNRSLGQSTRLLDGFGRRVKSHMEWIAGGMLVMGAIGVPAGLVKTIADVDKAMASMKQVAPQLHHDVGEFNKETMKLIDIAATYGEKIENVAEAATLWGRMYGRIAGGMEIVNTLTRQSMVLTVADNMTLVEANKSVEAAMFQYGLVAKNSTEALAYSGRIIDVWTKLAHTGGVSANDLAQGVQRSGAVAKQTGVDFEFLNAMIATTVRATGRSGSEIGNMIKSLLGSIHSDKATKEIEALGIATKTIGKDGVPELRKAQDVLLDIAVTATGTSKNLEDLFKGIAGGEPQLAA